jgi:hypothetical protein
MLRRPVSPRVRTCHPFCANEVPTRDSETVTCARRECPWLSQNPRLHSSERASSNPSDYNSDVSEVLLMGLPFPQMSNHLKHRLGAAATGAVICSLLGPSLGALVIGAVTEFSIRDAISWVKVLPFTFLIAVMMIGPVAFVLGAVGAATVQVISTRVRSAKALFVQTAILGLVLGGAVPLVVDLVYAASEGGRNKNFETGLLPLGAVSGLLCAAVVYWLLRRMGLLCLHPSEDSKRIGCVDGGPYHYHYRLSTQVDRKRRTESAKW